MKILGIVCSPRKGGNSEILVREALGAAEQAGAETKIILVADSKIAPCDACDACLKDGVCRIKDDMQMVYEEMDKADGIIFGTPSYFINVTAQAKAVMDRTYSLLFTRKLRGKVAAVIVTARRIGVGSVFSLVYSFFEAHRMIIAGGGAGYGVEKGAVREGPGVGIGDVRALDEARAIGKSVVRLASQLAKGKG